MEKTMLNSKKWTDEELTLIRLKNMAEWDDEDFFFYEDVNRELLEIFEEPHDKTLKNSLET